jgi:TetR/AcrR family transcriptional regulator
MPPTQTRDKEATQAQILAAALPIFAEKGFRGSSVSEIAKAAGVTKSLIHHHFGSKEGLWKAIKERHFREYFDAQMTMLGSPGTADLLERSVRAYFQFLGANPSFVRMMAWMQLDRTEESSFPLGEMLTREAIHKIREGQEQGHLRDDLHPFSILVSFLGLAEHWFQGKEIHCRALAPDDEMRDDEHYLADMMKIFFEGVLPQSPSV